MFMRAAPYSRPQLAIYVVDSLSLRRGDQSRPDSVKKNTELESKPPHVHPRAARATLCGAQPLLDPSANVGFLRFTSSHGSLYVWCVYIYIYIAIYVTEPDFLQRTCCNENVTRTQHAWHQVIPSVIGFRACRPAPPVDRHYFYEEFTKLPRG